MDSTTIEPKTAKQSFNFEPDVQRLFEHWKRANPMVIKSRMFNNALRVHLAQYRRGPRVSAGEGKVAA